MLSQKRAVRDLDIYGKTAAKFLSLIPRCCRPESLPPPDREEEHAAWSKGHGSPNVDTSSVVTVPKPSTPSRLSFFMRQQSAAPEAAGPAPRSPGTPSGSPCHRAGRWEEVSELDRNYLEYLRDARRSIDRCTWACRVWSAPYDGEEPSAGGAAPPPDGGPPLGPDCLSTPRPPGPPTPRTKKRGLPEEGAREGQGGPPGSSGEPGAGGPSPEARDSGTLVNGAHGPVEPGRPEGDVVVKKVRRSPQGEADGAGPPPEREHRPVLAQNGAAAPPSPHLQPPGWEPLPSVDSLIEELLARVPAEPNGAGVTIEAFTEELREIEAEMKNGGSGALPAPQEPPETPLSREEEEAFASFAALPEGDAAGRVPRPPDPLAQLVTSPPRAVGPPPSQPFTGPFVSVLFGKLENMLHNSLYVNFLLTGLVAQLACYPQPLLRSFLLNTNMVFQPSVKSLLQVLGSVKNKIESFAASQEDFPALLFKAKKYLIARGKLDWSDTPSAVPSLRRTETLGEGWRRLGQGLGPGGQHPVEARHGGLGAACFLGRGLGRGLPVALHGGLGAARGVGQGAGG
uniref:FHF complex subunit HOOK-interacting protein C-terminal domain-containing protein n=1 Tax=Accipiter nisus TaxID=211598 RepID=A0A8B9N9I4_9AVES